METLSFEETIKCAKDFKNLDRVILMVSMHPEWLTYIPEMRRWSIFNQIVFSGDTLLLNRILSTQINNPDFNFLCRNRENMTVVDIANLHQKPEGTKMKQRIEQFSKLDELLHSAKQADWKNCRLILEKDPSYVNSKPPYQRFYFINYLALANEVEQLKIVETIANLRFDFTLRVDQRKINIFAREHQANEFAQYLEEKYPAEFSPSAIDDAFYQANQENQLRNLRLDGLINDSVSIVAENVNVHPVAEKNDRKQVERETLTALNQWREKQAPVRAIIQLSTLDNIKYLLRCSLTAVIMKDPGKSIEIFYFNVFLGKKIFLFSSVVASDGFSYERSAIERWFSNSDRSPVTNEPLVHKDLLPNQVLKHMIMIIESCQN